MYREGVCFLVILALSMSSIYKLGDCEARSLLLYALGSANLLLLLLFLVLLLLADTVSEQGSLV